MNKRTVLSFTVSLAVLIGLGVYLAVLFPANAPTKKTQSNTTAETVKPSETPTSQAQAEQPGTYQPYSDATYAATQDSRRILFFHAPWCPQCRQLDKEISENKILSGISFLKVDYDTSQALRTKYGVTLQTTFVEVDHNGDKVKSVVAYNEPTYKNLVAQLGLHQ